MRPCAIAFPLLALALLVPRPVLAVEAGHRGPPSARAAEALALAIVRDAALGDIDALAPRLPPDRLVELVADVRVARSLEEIADLLDEARLSPLADDLQEAPTARPGPADAAGVSRLRDAGLTSHAAGSGLGLRLRRGVWMPSLDGHR
jgi:hypothetical protein